MIARPLAVAAASSSALALTTRSAAMSTAAARCTASQPHNPWTPARSPADWARTGVTSIASISGLHGGAGFAATIALPLLRCRLTDLEPGAVGRLTAGPRRDQ